MRQRRSEESGFVLLIVLVMSAGIALMLYRQLPRVAFESMRAKEEMLIERGEQYTRAVQLFIVRNKKYPKDLDDLDKGMGTRFLRRRYKDPFTGKADWKILQIDAMGNITNSKIKKKEEKKENQNTFISEFAGIGQTNLPGQGAVNVAMRRRPSDGPVEGPNGQAPLPLPSSNPDPYGQQQQQQVPNPFAQQQQNPQDQQPPVPINPATGQPLQPGQINPATGQPYIPVQQQINPATGQPFQAGQVPINPATGQPYVQGQMPINPSTGQPFPQGQVPIDPSTGQPFTQGQVPINPATGQPYVQSRSPQMQQMYPNGVPQYPGAVGVGAQIQPQQQQQQPTYPTNAAGQDGRMGVGANIGGNMGNNMGNNAPNAALDMIRKALTSPSPNMPMQVAPGMQLGPGIAGVASKREGASIKIYNEQQEYDKWEFVYDMRKDKRLQQQMGQMGGQNGMQANQQGMNPMGQPMTPIGQGMNQGMGGMQGGMGGMQGGMGGGMMGNSMGQGNRPGIGSSNTSGSNSGSNSFIGTGPAIGSMPTTNQPATGQQQTPARPPGVPGYPQQTYPQQPNTGYPQQPNTGYPQQPGFPQPRR